MIDTGATFIPVRVHSSSLLWLCIRLHDTSTKSHTRASHTSASHTGAISHRLGGVYIIPARLSFRYELTPVPSCGSIFIFIIPAQHLIPERVIPVRVHPGYCTGARFSFQYENSFRRCHVKAVRLFVPV